MKGGIESATLIKNNINLWVNFKRLLTGIPSAN